MSFPIEIKNPLPKDVYLSLNDELKSNWELNNVSYEGGKRSWGIDDNLKTNLIFLESSVLIKLKLKKIIKQDLKLCKIHVNGQTSNQESEFHIDFFQNDVWTFILFCGLKWNISWGGEFVSYNKEEQRYHYSPVIPNTGVLIPSNWDHYGSCPNSKTDEVRKTVAFSYCIPSIYNTIINENPHLKIFY